MAQLFTRPRRPRRPSRAPAALLATVVCAALLAAAGPPAAAAPAAPARGSASWLPPTPDQWPLVVDEKTTAPRTLTQGVSNYSDTLQTVGGAQRAQVLDVSLADPNVRLGVVESHDRLTDPADEVPSSMAQRTGAVAGVNGDFFEINTSGRPEGMVVRDGKLLKSPEPSRDADLWVHHDGTIGIGTETWTGTLTDRTNAASTPLTGVNAVDDLGAGALLRVTSDLGPTSIAAATVVTGHLGADGATLTVDSVATGVTDLPQLGSGQEDLVGSAAYGDWLAAHLHAGDEVSTTGSLGPDTDVVQALSGGAILVKDGQRAVPLQGGGDNNIDNPVTAVGVTKDGKQAIFAAFDGHQAEGVAQGLTRPQLAGWLMQHGAYQAILFDGGGSTQMVGRLPGRSQASVLNTPSDGHERPVANGLFLYSREAAPAAATRAVVNGGKPVTALAGTSVDVPAYALDRRDNPAADPVALTVSPPGSATVHGTTLTLAGRPGRGTLHIRAGHASSSVPLSVVAGLRTLAVTPSQADLGNGATQALSFTATAAGGAAVSLPPSAVHWSVDHPELGAVDAGGTFTAAATGTGMVTVTATAGGAKATVSLAVGSTTVPVDPLTDLSKWSVTSDYMNVYPRKVPSPGPHSTTNGSIALDTSTSARPGDGGSMDVHYTYPNKTGTYDLSVYLNDPQSEQVPLLGGDQAPIGLGVWVKGNADLASRPGDGLAPGIVTLNVGIWQASNQPTSFYPTGITFDGWQYVVAKLPTGLQYPLRINYLGLVTIKPGPDLTGDVHLADLEALYSPRPPKPATYTAIPKNPSWLQFTDTSSFRPGGTTVAAFDDAHTTAATPGATGTVALKSLPGVFGSLPAAARPQQVQALGDMSDNGTTGDLTNLRTLMDGLGVPYRDAVGNHEITQGAAPENGDFTSVFGATHYAYDAGAARLIVTDSGHIGITASDPFQVPDEGESQYLWLARQLSANTQRVAIVVTHTPAYDPHPRADSQFTDRWEAQMYEALVQRYQRTHPGVHVLMMFGHARGFAEDLREPDGTDDAGGIPNFVVADLGTPPYATPDQGGFFNYGLFHILPDGTVQFAVQPLLASVAVTAPAPSLARGGKEQLTATGTSIAGDDLTALQVPVQDPVSRHWTSSDPRVATVDAASGTVTAHQPGTARISVTAGGVTGTATVTVTAG
ncbi:Calcineurin-like phosphoesterase [Actinacidiphila yanglinensis]|uniref:Calcineurin-like phosphoesterase n=1 Tax=Actinacidiphila yanglinensis TaxID=310779 RepID=A0A1H6D8S4_9ACTN|nr:phosphodiester glycosidase family protein [Actinacidiphila yanglinensis]SEG81740.1 Calcineurin-like phosphoesterase [Actinacidiphila yanglinensis]